MFRWLFLYWYNNIDTPSNMLKINLWSYINIRLFKVKLSNYIVYFIFNLNNLYFKKIKIFYKNNFFNFFYKSISIYIFIIYIFISLFIVIL